MLSKKTIIQIIILIFLVFNLSALIVAGRGGGKGQGLGKLGLDVFSPLNELVTAAVGGISDIWKSYFNLISVGKNNLDLTKEINEYHAKETLYKEVFLENKRLRKLLNFSDKINNEYIAAEVVGRDSSKWFNTIVINRGISSGIKLNFPVIVPQGIVGQVIEVSERYSKVLLITDRMSGVDCLVQESRGRGVLSGTGENSCSLKYILRKFDVASGNHIITSGMDKIFPKGLRVGIVTEVNKKNSGIFQDIEVKPFVDFEKLEEVLIIFNNSGES